MVWWWIGLGLVVLGCGHMRPAERAVAPLLVLEQRLAASQRQTDSNEEGERPGSVVPDTAIAGLPMRRLPTLRESLERLSAEQDTIQETLEHVQQDVQRIGLMVAELTELVRELSRLQPGSRSVPLREPRAGKSSRRRPLVREPAEKSEDPSGSEAATAEKLSNVPPAVLQQYTKALQHIARQEYRSAWGLLEHLLKEAKDPVLVSNARYWRGDIAFRQGHYAQAIEELQTVIQNPAAPKAAAAYALLAESYLRQGDRDRARHFLQTLVQRFPTSEFAPRALKRLQQL